METLSYQNPLVDRDWLAGATPEDIEAVITRGADPNEREERNLTPLEITMTNLNGYFGKEKVRILVENGAKVNVANNDFGFTPLSDAVESRCLDTTHLLIERGADIHARDNRQNTLLHQAVAISIEDSPPCHRILRLLLERGTNPNAANEKGDTPLHEAIDDASLVEMLVKYGAKVNEANQYGFTPLHEAAYWGQCHKAEALIKHGANLRARSADGKISLDLACIKQGEQSQTANLLRTAMQA